MHATTGRGQGEEACQRMRTRTGSDQHLVETGEVAGHEKAARTAGGERRSAPMRTRSYGIKGHTC